jgi:hypothetical protein
MCGCPLNRLRTESRFARIPQRSYLLSAASCGAALRPRSVQAGARSHDPNRLLRTMRADVAGPLAVRSLGTKGGSRTPVREGRDQTRRRSGRPASGWPAARAARTVAFAVLCEVATMPPNVSRCWRRTMGTSPIGPNDGTSACAGGGRRPSVPAAPASVRWTGSLSTADGLSSRRVADQRGPVTVCP